MAWNISVVRILSTTASGRLITISDSMPIIVPCANNFNH